MMHRERDEVLKNYFPVLDQAQMIYLLNDLIKDDKIVISDLGFSSPNEEVMGDLAVKIWISEFHTTALLKVQ